MTEEVYKAYPHHSQYCVSTSGNVRRIGGPVLNLGKQSGPYLHITTSGGGVKKTRYIHTMVLETFVGPRPVGFQASHLNGNRYDNRVENLIWESPSSNCRRKMGHGTEPTGEERWSAKLLYDEAVTIKMSPMTECRLAKVFGVSQTEINRIKNGTTWPNIPPFTVVYDIPTNKDS